MPLRIAFDLDGVLADMKSELVRQAELLFGEAMSVALKSALLKKLPQRNRPPTPQAPARTSGKHLLKPRPRMLHRCSN